MKLIWCSDVHLNFLNERQRKEFYARLEGDAIVLSGDIAESRNVVFMIGEMEAATKLPVYFVLGNHDFYGSSVVKVRQSVAHLKWLPKTTGIPLSEDTILIGVDGWGDCRAGDFYNSRMVMNDWTWITELFQGYGKGQEGLKQALQKLADADAKTLKRRVTLALKKGFKRIIIVSHVPSFEDASMHAGRKSTSDGLPFYTSVCLGEAILPIAKKHPQVDFLWLSGHTHSKAIYKPCNNMTVKVAASEYYHPTIAAIIEIK